MGCILTLGDFPNIYILAGLVCFLSLVILQRKFKYAAPVVLLLLILSRFFPSHCATPCEFPCSFDDLGFLVVHIGIILFAIISLIRLAR
jgi:hypothetical protein